MPDIADRDRLQPSLLDRLTDLEPDKRQESREKRVMSQQQLREVVLRDLSWLLNTSNLASVEDIDDYPLVAASTVNYGIRDLTGKTASSVDSRELERVVRQAIWDFEPRIERDSVEVRLIRRDDEMSNNAVTFEIEGTLWGQPLPMQIYLRTEIDLEIGDVKVTDRSGRVAG
jgi:type VI secretion system protein ImpF